MNADLQRLIDLQEVDGRVAALRAEIASLPKKVQQIEAKLAGCKARVEAAQAALKADETARRKHESDIQDQQKVSKYRDQSLAVKTNDEYRALMHEIEFAEKKVRESEDKILEIMVATDERKAALKAAEVELKEDIAENEQEKEHVRRQTAEDEAQLAELEARRKELRSAIGDDTLRHYDRVLKLRGSALAAVHEDQMCTGCRVMLRPQPFQDVMRNEEIVFCDSCQRIVYYVPPPPKPEEEEKPRKSKKAAKAAIQEPEQVQEEAQASTEPPPESLEADEATAQ